MNFVFTEPLAIMKFNERYFKYPILLPIRSNFFYSVIAMNIELANKLPNKVNRTLK